MVDLNDELLLTEHAAELLKCSVRKIRKLIKNGDIPARRRGVNQEGPYEILKSSCVAYMHQLHKNVSVKADCQGKSKERFKSCQSNYGTEYGTVISLHRAGKELEKALAHQTRS
ncbi:helix-turn-helix domain-containing protein [Providencia sp. PROV110]|uniref:helix-turn-helix domain-containing protein n=1 Tax=Providencia sp. PROV110 TaxID=2949821 RepID=UPI003FA6CC79